MAAAEVEDLATPHARFRDWLTGQALPLWAGAGRDAPGLGFHERLTNTAEPADLPYKRMRVQARQIYCFSQAAVLGWRDGLEAARDSWDFITRHGASADGAWARTLGREGGVLDGTADLYDLAFVLFATAWYARATGETEPLVRARRTLDWIRAHMADPQAGFFNTLPVEPGPRQQNPHMHLLEAVLALYDLTGEDCYAETAHELLSLFHRFFRDPAGGTLGEFFAADLAPAPGEAGDHVEPGHHFEWVWLLEDCDRLLGTDTRVEAERLYAFAERFGIDQSGLVRDVVGRDGRVLKAATRLWPQTEAVKAHAVMRRRGRSTRATIGGTVGLLLDRFFADCVPGGWHEHFGTDGSRLVPWIPASSLYHIVMAFAELDRSVQPHRGGSGGR